MSIPSPNFDQDLSPSTSGLSSNDSPKYAPKMIYNNHHLQPSNYNHTNSNPIQMKLSPLIPSNIPNYNVLPPQLPQMGYYYSLPAATNNYHSHSHNHPQLQSQLHPQIHLQPQLQSQLHPQQQQQPSHPLGISVSSLDSRYNDLGPLAHSNLPQHLEPYSQQQQQQLQHHQLQPPHHHHHHLHHHEQNPQNSVPISTLNSNQYHQPELQQNNSGISKSKKVKKNSRRKHRNSHLGCGTCKKRRIKCDETLPSCNNCLKGKLHCAYLNLDSNAQAALRMAQYNQLLRVDKTNSSTPSNDNKSDTTSPGQNQQYQPYQIPQMILSQPNTSSTMNHQIPSSVSGSGPIQNPAQHQLNGMIYVPIQQPDLSYPPIQSFISHEHQNLDQDVKLPPIKNLTHDLDKAPKISNLLL